MLPRSANARLSTLGCEQTNTLSNLVQSKNAIQNVISPGELKLDKDYLDLIKNPTPRQLECRKKVPASPSRIVIGIEGFTAYSQSAMHYYRAHPTGKALTSDGSLIHTMIHKSVQKVAGVYWDYFPETDVNSERSTGDAIRCAYEYASKAYLAKDGSKRKVYSSITIMGYSFGADSATMAVESLSHLGLAVDLVATVDPIKKPHRVFWDPDHYTKPDNVKSWINFHQTEDPVFLLRGYSVPGADNVLISGYSHANANALTKSPELQKRLASEILKLPTCRKTYSSTSNTAAPGECATGS